MKLVSWVDQCLHRSLQFEDVGIQTREETFPKDKKADNCPHPKKIKASSLKKISKIIFCNKEIDYLQKNTKCLTSSKFDLKKL